MLLTEETLKLPITGSMWRESLVAGGFPSQTTSYAESVFMWRLRHDHRRRLIIISFSLKGPTAVKFGRHPGSICHSNFQAWVLMRSYDNLSYQLLKYVPELMMTSSNGNNFRVTGPLCGEFIGHRWIPLTKASDAELWCFLWSAGLDIKHLAYMPVGHVVLKIYMPCKNFYVPSQYLYKPCKAYVYCWEISTCPDWKITCPVGHITTKV